MKVLELFAGTKSISNEFEAKGHKTLTVDWNEQFDVDLNMNVLDVTPELVIEKLDGKPDIIWASPDCTTYSIAGIRHHRVKEADGNLKPISDYAKVCDKVNKHMLKLIESLKPKFFYIENPRGGMRKMEFIQHINRYTVTYCQYGDFRMKPTDIWTNHPNPKFKPICKNGAPCHTPAPRGSTTGTQGMKLIDKSRIPKELCQHIVRISEESK